MINKSQTSTISPPRLIGSLTTGFNTVANNIFLILPPLILDLLLWFGPHFRIKTLAEPVIERLLTPLSGVNTPDLIELVQVAKTQWKLILDQFNLLSALRAFPFGLPSLLSSELQLNSPLGAGIIREMPTLFETFFWYILFTLLGLAAGSFYLHILARYTNSETHPGLVLKDILWQTGQIIFLSIFLLLLMLILTIPLTLMVSIFFIFSPLLAQLVMLVVFFVAIWLALPLVFTPHGIFTHRLNFLSSLIVSSRLVRSYFSISMLFLMIGLLINQGLNVLWILPPETSWLRLIGITGHAFISTGLLSASFVYYRDGLKWIDENQKLSAKKAEAVLKK